MQTVLLIVQLFVRTAPLIVQTTSITVRTDSLIDEEAPVYIPYAEILTVDHI